MAYGKKNNGMINRNPWSRSSQSKPRRAPRAAKPNIRSRGSMLNTSSILTGRTPAPNNKAMSNVISMAGPEKPGMNPGPQRTSPRTERRGGKRRMPFLSNTGPGKKTGY